MTAKFNGIKVKIPKGYNGPDENGFYTNGHGVEYAIISYGSGEDAEICLETVYSDHVRTIPLEKAQG